MLDEDMHQIDSVEAARRKGKVEGLHKSRDVVQLAQWRLDRKGPHLELSDRSRIRLCFSRLSFVGLERG